MDWKYLYMKNITSWKKYIYIYTEPKPIRQDWGHNSCQSHFSHSITLSLFSVAGWRLHNYIISARAHRRLIPTPPPPAPLVSVQNTLIPGGLACLKNEGKWAYSGRTGAAHPHGGAPQLSPAMISRHDRAHVYGTTRASVWLPASLCRFADLRDALMEREDVMRQSRDFWSWQSWRAERDCKCWSLATRGIRSRVNFVIIETDG